MSLKIIRNNSISFNNVTVKELTGSDADRIRSECTGILESAYERNLTSIVIRLNTEGMQRTYGLRTAIDVINDHMTERDIEVFLVVPSSKSNTGLADKLRNILTPFTNPEKDRRALNITAAFGQAFMARGAAMKSSSKAGALEDVCISYAAKESAFCDEEDYIEPVDQSALKERLKHISDPFGVYLLYMSDSKGISLTELESTAWVSKHIVHNVKKKPDIYKPDKRTAFQFCVGLKLNLDETKDMLKRAGYAISESILEDKIWEFYIENEHYDIIDISDSLEQYGLKPIVDF
jgi:hypothetical protein